jgi:putative FmdB family regulatory protein
MPLYEYKCQECHGRFEIIRKFSDPDLETCTLCGGGPVERLLSSPAIQFKGSGWYITDYSKKGKAGGAESADTSTTSDSPPASGATPASPKADTTPPATKPAASE